MMVMMTIQPVSLKVRHARLAFVAFLLFVTCLQGTLHLFFVPPWQHYDEPTHFEYAWLIANRDGLPQLKTQDTVMRRDVAASMVQHDFFWNLPSPDLLTDDEEIWIGISELSHPPFYYWLVSLPLRLVRHLDVTTQLHVARTVSLVMFVVTSLAALGLVRLLLPEGHPIRWLLPLTVALLPPFASHMTAVNNDVGAVMWTTLFLWGAVHLIRKGISVWALLWVSGTALAAVLTKNTAGIALLFLPVAVTLSVWAERQWRWSWLWLGGASLGFLLLLAVVEWGDAAYWYREEFESHQTSATRTATKGRPDAHVITLEVSPSDPGRRLLNPLLPEVVIRLRGQTVTVGGWVWADQPGEIYAPGFLFGPENSRRLVPVGQSLTVTTTPTFFAHTYYVPAATEVLYYAFWAQPMEPTTEPFHLYLDDAFMIRGEWVGDDPSTLAPGSELPEEIAAKNLLRNPSGEQSWLRLRPWVHRVLEGYSRRSPTYLLGAIQDIPKNAPFVLEQVAPWVLEDFFAAFGWGHVRLDSNEWRWLHYILLTAALVGAVRWMVLRRRDISVSLLAALLLLTLFAGIVWVNVLFWPLPFVWARVQMPAARYGYVAILPTVLLLVGGWYALWPISWKRWAVVGWLALLILLNVASLNTIYAFYYAGIRG